MIATTPQPMVKNLVNRLVFEVHCPAEDTAIGLRHTIAHTLQGEVETGIDKICSKHTQQAEAIRIDTLEIDLGQFHPHAFDRQLIAVFLERFEKALLKELAEMSFPERTASGPRSRIETLVHFLETGQRAWWVSETPNFNQWLLDYLLENNGDLLRFLDSKADNKTLWRRLGLQFPDEVHEQLVTKIPHLQRTADRIGRWVREVSESLGLAVHAHAPGRINQLVIENAPDIRTPGAIERKAFQLFSAHIQLLMDMGISEKAILEDIGKVLNKGTLTETDTKPSPEKIEIRTPTEKGQKYRSGHGGAVILAQFLKPFFKNLGLYENGEWLEETAKFKAVHLINHMCKGEVAAAEYDLNLEKLLCGLPLNAPIPTDAELSVEEIKEAALLLESVLEHWQALKNTSVDGLRKGFLLRDCLISFRDPHWQIYLERTTADVLLDKLPWGFSVIIAPWNDYQIYVEW